MARPELVKPYDHFDNSPDLSGLISYLQKNRQDADYIAVTPGAMSLGAELILQSGEPVMALGGFNGENNPLSVAEFQRMVIRVK